MCIATCFRCGGRCREYVFKDSARLKWCNRCGYSKIYISFKRECITLYCPICTACWNHLVGMSYDGYKPDLTHLDVATCPDCEKRRFAQHPHYIADKNADYAQRIRAGQIAMEAFSEQFSLDRALRAIEDRR